MKLIMYGEPYQERPGVLLEGRLIFDLELAELGTPHCLEEILEMEALPLISDLLDGKLHKAALIPLDAVRLGPPLSGIGKIVACGLNYRGHAKEMGSPFPPNPLFFGKAPSAIAGPYDDLLLPPLDWSKEVDYEVELGIIIGSQCRGVSVQDAPAYIAGYTIVNDMTARDIQRAESQWFRAKSYDGFCPIGPYLVTRDEIDNPDALALSTHINGEMRQHSSTSDMIFSTAEIVSFASMSMTLEPGDIIATGTPAGIGGGMKPPRFLHPGDVIEMKVEGLGEQRVRIIEGEE